MSEIQTAFLQRCIDTLEESYTMLQNAHKYSLVTEAETDRWMRYRDN